jgi:hypothetical protein
MFNELFSQYELGELSSDSFSNGLWDALIKFIPYYDNPLFLDIPKVVQNYYSSHDLEYAVGNAGFYESAMNSPERLHLALQGYEALGLCRAAALIVEAARLLTLEDEEELDAHLDEVWAALDTKLDDAGWWAQEARLNYALANRDVFEALDSRIGVKSSSSN